ncbi:GerAB/ArcD/ProY family transporter [Neobacillus soli]|uniref:GerAB/ArcD/ProY family transporter n=1 Tax=Neobacillus soli TaxID=220688 RepID=UPI000824DD02|nr:endospore germination permease [Neobacillus soli]
MKTEQISQNQLLLFMILYFYSTLVGFSAAHLIHSSQYDSLLVVCIGGVAGGIYAYFIIKLANRRPNEFFVHYGSEIFPKWIHILFTGFYFLTYLHISAFILREYEDFIVQTYLSETPNWAVGAILGMVVAITARLGIQTIFRTAQGLFFLVLIASAMNTFFIGKELKWDRWMAFITNHSGHDIFTGSYTTIPFFGEIVVLVFIFPYLTPKKKTFQSVAWAILLSILLISVNIAFLLLLFGPNLASHLTYPMLEMVRYIRIADFIENLDPFLISIWSTTVYLKISLLFFLSTHILAHLFRLKDHRPLTFSLAAVMVALSLQMSGGTAALTGFYKESWATYSYFIEGIPILYLLMDTLKRFIRKRSSKKEEISQKEHGH